METKFNKTDFKGRLKMIKHGNVNRAQLRDFGWWISELRLDPLFLLISRLNNACSPLIINLQIN